MLEEQVHQGATKALLRLAEQSGWLSDRLNGIVQGVFDEVAERDSAGAISIDAEALMRQPIAIQTELLRFALGELMPASLEDVDEDIRLPGMEHIKGALRLIEDRRTGKRLMLPGSVCVAIEYGRVVFSRGSAQSPSAVTDEVLVPVPGQAPLPGRREEIVCRLEDFQPSMQAEEQHRAEPSIERLDFEEVRPPLVVRAPAEGDRFHPIGAPGSKKVADFFVDQNVPRSERREALLLCDELGPVWLIGHRLDDRVKLTDRTRRVLRLEVRPSATWTGPQGAL
jgi:tRNA(Ile)-lysidine synthase